MRSPRSTAAAAWSASASTATPFFPSSNLHATQGGTIGPSSPGQACSSSRKVRSTLRESRASWPGTKTTTSRFCKQLAVGRQRSPDARQATGTGEKSILLLSRSGDKYQALRHGETVDALTDE